MLSFIFIAAGLTSFAGGYPVAGMIQLAAALVLWLPELREATSDR